jgi:hypothetical protein
VTGSTGAATPGTPGMCTGTGTLAHECVSVWQCGHMGMLARWHVGWQTHSCVGAWVHRRLCIDALARWHVGVLVCCTLVCRCAAPCIASARGSVGRRIHVAASVHRCVDGSCWRAWPCGCVGALARGCVDASVQRERGLVER